MKIGNNVSTAEARIFAQAMIDADLGVELLASQSQQGEKTTTTVILTQPDSGRNLSFYAEAAPSCYSDLSQIPTTPGGRFILKSANIGDQGINLILEDEQTGHNYPLRVILSRASNCAVIVSYQCTHQTAGLKAAA